MSRLAGDGLVGRWAVGGTQGQAVLQVAIMQMQTKHGTQWVTVDRIVYQDPTSAAPPHEHRDVSHRCLFSYNGGLPRGREVRGEYRCGGYVMEYVWPYKFEGLLRARKTDQRQQYF